MATGDMKNNIRQLQAELKAAKFTQNIDIDGLVQGSPKTYLGIYHYLFTTYSTKFNKDISNSNNELYGKSDMRFMEAVYKILRDMFDYKPQINREQFFSPGFAERKVIMATDILRHVRGRYKPPKSSTFRVAASRDEPQVLPPEKVQQEPFERPRKVASKSSPNVAGAIVLPARSTSASGGFKIPKSAVPGHRLSYEGPLFGASAPPTKSRKDRHTHLRETDAEVDVVDITAATPDQSMQEPVTQSQLVIDKESTDSVIRRKVVDLVSPALLKMNERLGKLEINMKNFEDRDPVKSSSEPPSSAALTAGLSKQMNDIIFKLETLTSKVVLIENRLLMVEARLDDEEKYRRVLSSSYSYHNSKRQTPDSALASAQQAWATKNDRGNNMKTSQDVENGNRKDEDKENKSEESKRNSENECDNENGEYNSISDLEVVVVREDGQEAEAKTSKMAFIKTLVNPNDTENTLVTDASAVEQSADITESHQVSEQSESGSAKDKLPPAGPSSSQPSTTTAPSFDDLISPIRPFAAISRFSHLQDESVVSIPYAAYDPDNSEDRRCTSTPTRLALDTSTLDRVSRINQMMAETQQLLS